jgi:hypothetical protein
VLYNYTLNDFRKWGPDLLQEVNDFDTLIIRLLKPLKLLKASRIPKASKIKASPKSPPIIYMLPEIDFPNIPQLLIKPRLTILLPSI